MSSLNRAHPHTMKLSMKMLCLLKIFLIFRVERFDHFEHRKEGYGKMGDDGGGAYDGGDSPASFDEIERPPLRHIDKYVRAECPCLTARYTVAMMTCIGFIISFGIRCNLSMAKLTLAEMVSSLYSKEQKIYFIKIDRKKNFISG